MLDSDRPKSKEEELEQIKFEISNVFNSLKLEILDPDLKERLNCIRESLVSLLKQTDETEVMSEETAKVYNEFFDVLTTINEKIKSQFEFNMTNIKISIEQARISYDAGQVKKAYDLLTDSRDEYSGPLVLAENMASYSEEFKEIYLQTRYLIKLISSLEF